MQKIHKFIAIHITTLALVISAMTPLAPSISYAQGTCSYPNDSSLDKKQRDCSKDSARTWNCRLNRCVTTAAAQADREKFKECAEKVDDAERKACHDKYAESESGVSGGDKGSSAGVAGGAVVGTAAAVYAVMMGMAMAEKTTDEHVAAVCFSHKILMGGAIIMILTELYMLLVAEKKFKKIGSKYGGEQVSEDAHSAQLRALEYLKEEQKEVAALAKTRANAYTLQMVIYTAALIIATIEKIRSKNPSDGKALTCEAAKNTSFMMQYGGTMTFAGVGFVLAGILLGFAKKQESDANDNVAAIEKTIKKFKDVMEGSSYCSPHARQDLNNPQCYCYDTNGSKNSDRTNSQACQALWAQNDQNLMAGSTNYAGKVDAKTKVCMLRNGQMDRKCQCRRMINKTTGENACMKVPMGTNSFGSIGTALGLPGIGATVGNLAGGNTSLGQLNGSSLEKQLAKSRKILDNTVAKLNKDRAAEGLAPVSLNMEKQAASLVKKLSPKQIAKGKVADIASLGASSRPTSGALAKALKDADKSVGLKRSSTMLGGSGLRGGGKGSSKGDQFAFLNNAGGGGGKVMGGPEKKNYDYKDNDIVKNKSVSIWKIISARYSKSGVRRLFSDEKEGR